MQSFSQFVCFPWVWALFLCVCFSILWGKTEKNISDWTGIVLIMLLAPFTIGFGFVIPFYVIFIAIMGPRSKRTVGLLLVALIAFSAAYFTWFSGGEKLTLNEQLGTSFPSFTQAFKEHPFDLIRFIFVLLGSPLVWWHVSAKNYALVLGVSFFILTVSLSFIKKSPIKKIMADPFCFFGLIFVSLLCISRWNIGGSAVGLEIRYTSVLLFFMVAMIFHVTKHYENRAQIRRIFLSVIMILTWTHGLPVEKDWLKERKTRFISFQNCIQSRGNKLFTSVDEACIRDIYPKGMTDEKSFLFFVNSAYQNKKTVFTEALKGFL